MATDPLHAYLNDHLAGATTGRDLSRTLAHHFAGRPFGPDMARIADEIAEDRGTLEAIMGRAGVRRSPIKQALAWIAERAGRSGGVRRGADAGPLGELRALEMLSLGIEGKACLWEALRARKETVPAPAGMDFDDLIARAREQRETLEDQRLAAYLRVVSAAGAAAPARAS